MQDNLSAIAAAAAISFLAGAGIASLVSSQRQLKKPLAVASALPNPLNPKVLPEIFSLEGKVAVVTGASSGIGLGIARALHAAGCKVILVARRKELIEAEAKRLEGERRSGSAAAVAADVCKSYRASDSGGIEELADRICEPFGVPDVVFNNAGVNLRQGWKDISPDSWATTLDLNLAVPFFFTRALVQRWLGQREDGNGGREEGSSVAGNMHVVNIASLQSSLAFPNSVPYGASKGGVAQLTRAMAEAWAGEGVTVNAIAPGFFSTELTAPVFCNKSIVRALSEKTMVGRTGEVSDLVGSALFLASDASNYVCGQVLYVDGGLSAKG
eukprot:CAMPEP_0183313766 /NCGR_PEP_ID=MMETSP0160_2-20130417/46432_1 /TAXON_ID=2839 ORGANISM="Odontella Sinensis, Strain Grunow 1884" /NCGR_SAMPLE_ID=MMETSP0160_2 /ASSEMBLY_ACC=CAM_ASM_000250 /LENGTH=327 /DNA_ID=CAMNT_0025478921 /DNA_START=42 /DNA_END=1025 /DNA_ORIENTATION=+